jgi:glycerol kinase
VPALVGLGAPYWDAEARGLICGITRGTTRAHLARATLEGVAHEVTDLVEAMANDLAAAGEAKIARMRVDGGMSANALLLELQANYADVQVERPRDIETTARGAAMLAALGARHVRGLDDLRAWSSPDATFAPDATSNETRARARDAWKRAVARTRG